MANKTVLIGTPRKDGAGVPAHEEWVTGDTPVDPDGNPFGGSGIILASAVGGATSTGAGTVTLVNWVWPVGTRYLRLVCWDGYQSANCWSLDSSWYIDIIAGTIVGAYGHVAWIVGGLVSAPYAGGGPWANFVLTSVQRLTVWNPAARNLKVDVLNYGNLQANWVTISALQ